MLGPATTFFDRGKEHSAFYYGRHIHAVAESFGREPRFEGAGAVAREVDTPKICCSRLPSTGPAEGRVHALLEGASLTGSDDSVVMAPVVDLMAGDPLQGEV